MYAKKTSLWLVALWFGLCAGASAQNLTSAASGEKSFDIRRVDTPPVIDGRLDDAAWGEATVIEDLHQINPVEYNEPSERTEIRLVYDDNALYVSARLWDSRPDEITAQVLRQGEGLNDEDRFAIIIDPNLDRRSGYRFQINPNGVRWDGLYSDTTNLQSDWDGIWRAAATRDDQGWIAEIAIPFKTLSFDPGIDAWGVNFERTIQRNDETLAWVSRNRQLNPGVSGRMVGFRDLQQGRGLDIVPSVSAIGRKAFGPVDSTSNDLEPSLDVFYKLTPSLSGALTLNTDFSATEVDDRQVNLTRFSLFFPEKRDFFLQDADIFEFGRIGGGGGGGGFSGGGGGGGGGGFRGGGDQNGRPFFSRRLGLSSAGESVDINAGAKLSGRVGIWNIGMLAIHQDSYETATETIDASDIIVGRVSANVLGESNVGVIFTDGDPGSNADSSTIGTDFLYRNTRLPGGRVLEAESWYQQVDEDGILDNDRAYGFGISSPNNTGWRGGVSAKQIEENFDPAVGFVNEAGIRQTSGDLAYRLRFGDRWLRAINASIEASRTERLDTGLLDRSEVQMGFNIESATQDRLFTRFTESKENLPTDFYIYCPLDPNTGFRDCTRPESVVIPAGNYNWRSAFVGLRTGNQRKLSAFVSAGTGDYYDGQSTNISTNIDWRPSRNLSISGGYSWRDADLPDGSFQVRQSELSVQYVFSATLSWVNRVQYDNFSEVIGFNSRLHWIPEAGREGYIVLNHNIADVDKNDSFHSTSADLSIKFSYTWRL